MLLHDRLIAVKIAVFCFFTLSFIGWISGLSSFVCCKRALIGAVITYIAGIWAVKAINIILVRAMIEGRMNQRKRSSSTENRSLEYEGKRGGRTNR
ncbi:MAG: hypothetical protein JXM79_07690 [Sedimentisphaerales bacterium]|nr:hypothetical protein [Sedimentisphaerales bacterium]